MNGPWRPRTPDYLFQEIEDERAATRCLSYCRRNFPSAAELGGLLFFREVLGVDGIVRQVYGSPEMLSQFEQTPEYQKIQQMLAKLRENDGSPARGPAEPTRVITVRLPSSTESLCRGP